MTKGQNYNNWNYDFKSQNYSIKNLNEDKKVKMITY